MPKEKLSTLPRASSSSSTSRSSMDCAMKLLDYLVAATVSDLPNRRFRGLPGQDRSPEHRDQSRVLELPDQHRSHELQGR